MEVVRLSGTPDNRNGEWLRVRQYGYHAADVRSIAELAQWFDLADLEPEGGGLARGRRVVRGLYHVLLQPGRQHHAWRQERREPGSLDGEPGSPGRPRYSSSRYGATTAIRPSTTPSVWMSFHLRDATPCSTVMPAITVPAAPTAFQLMSIADLSIATLTGGPGGLPKTSIPCLCSAQSLKS